MRNFARLAIAVLSLSPVFSLFGQAVTSLNGTVTDPSGAVVPGAHLTLVRIDTGAQREDISDAQGRYGFSQVAPGDYRLTAKAAGFSDVVVNKLQLLVNQPATVPVIFEKLGTTSTVVTIEAAATQVNTTDASLGNAVETHAITQLPFEARNVVGLLSLQPGVTFINTPDPGSTGDYRSGSG